jgi:hypothetical protein
MNLPTLQVADSDQNVLGVLANAVGYPVDQKKLADAAQHLVQNTSNRTTVRKSVFIINWACMLDSVFFLLQYPIFQKTGICDKLYELHNGGSLVSFFMHSVRYMKLTIYRKTDHALFHGALGLLPEAPKLRHSAPSV